MDSKISASEIAERIQNNDTMRLLDVRGVMEYHSYNIGGLNIPLDQLADALPLDNWQQQDEIIVICKAGLRSKTAQSILQQNGYTNVRNLTGGLLALHKIK